MLNLLMDSPWPGVIIWVLLYTSDFLMTLTCARLRRAGAGEKIVLQGSLEINPFMQKDVDRLRYTSPRFFAGLIVVSIWLTLLWRLRLDTPGVYSFTLGAIILTEFAVHVRHFRNFFLFRAIVRTDEVRGRIEYSRALSLRLSAVEFLVFSSLFTVGFLFTGSSNWFFLGGASTCCALAIQHRLLAWRAAAKQRAATAGP